MTQLITRWGIEWGGWKLGKKANKAETLKKPQSREEIHMPASAQSMV